MSTRLFALLRAHWFDLGATIAAAMALWLGIASILVSFGDVVAHTLVFNLKGRRLYNPGMATALLLFLPLTLWFFHVVVAWKLATPLDYALGFGLGVLLNL